jgi:hypothetical protein
VEPANDASHLSLIDLESDERLDRCADPAHVDDGLKPEQHSVIFQSTQAQLNRGAADTELGSEFSCPDSRILSELADDLRVEPIDRCHLAYLRSARSVTAIQNDQLFEKRLTILESIPSISGMTASAGGRTPVESIGRFTVAITMEGSEGDELMRAASVFHRRQIDIRQATYRRTSATSRMEVVVEASASRVRIVALTLQNIPGVTACEVSGCESEQSGVGQLEAEVAITGLIREAGYRPDRVDQRRAG